MDPVTVTTEAEDVPATVTVTTEAKVVPAKRSKTTRHLPLPRRQFYHSQSGQPMTLEEVISDRDSGDEANNEVEAEAPDLMIDDSMDNKEISGKFIQLWNYFAKKNRVMADAHIPWACEEFSKLYKKELHDNLKFDTCWRLFMIRQCKYGILDAATITKCNTIIQKYPNSSDMDVDKNDHQNKNNEENKETITHASSSEYTMCTNGDKDEMDVGVKALDKEPSQVVDMPALFERSFGKRPIKQTPKMKEMMEKKLITHATRGSSSHRGRGRTGRGGRGRTGRRGRGCEGPGSRGNFI